MKYGTLEFLESVNLSNQIKMASTPMAQDIMRCDLCTESTFTGTTPAEVICKTCNINLCKVCMADHISSNLSVNHDIHGIRFSSHDFNFILPTCHVHPKLKCELNCEECNIPVCSKCIAGTHKKHGVVEISKIFKSQKEIMEQDNQELEKLILPTYEKINAEYEDKISKISGGYDNFRKTITKQGEEWHKLVDIAQKKYLKKADEMEKEDVAILQRDQTDIRKKYTTAQDVLQANKRSLQSNDTNKVINYKSKNNELRKISAKMELSPPSFSPGKFSEEMLSQMFGEIKPSKKAEVPAYNIQHHGLDSASLVKQFIDKPKLAEIDSGFDQPFRVCCVPDKEQLYVRGFDSRIIKHLDSKGKLLNQITTKSGNKDSINLSVTRDGRLVYSDKDDRSVNIVNNNKIDSVVRLQGWKPRTVCSTSTDDLLVTMTSDDSSKSKVVRYAGSTATQEIQFDDQGQALYSDPHFIAENRNLDICVTNLFPNILIVVDKTGKLKIKYDGNHKMKKWLEISPNGLATDSQCHILVSDYNNDCVHILTHDGSFIRYIDNCNLISPEDLSISSDDTLYVVGNEKKVKVIRYLQ